jgi:hypothetical protein
MALTCRRLCPERAKRVERRLLVFVCALIMCVGGAFLSLHASGPLLTDDHRPVLWASRTITGGPLGTTTVSVDPAGKRTVYYHVDSGPLGLLTNEQAVRLVDRIFGEYTAIPTADIDFVNAGPIRDPRNGLAIDVNGTNLGLMFSPTLQNPIVFDSDGGITGTGGVLGFFGFLATTPTSPAELAEGIVVLNGSVLGPPFFMPVPSFLGVFTHEFGHFAGPLDHAQINGNIGFSGTGSVRPPGFNAGTAYDLFAPFTETLFPFLYGPPPTATTPVDSGFFIATLDADTRNGLSSLYPTAAFHQATGAIDGRVFFRSGDTKIPVDGMNIVARRISQGAYPPLPGTVAYPTPPLLDADGVPSAPPAQAATDSLATASSAVTGLDFGFGHYRVQGLDPGDYMVILQRINPNFTGVSSIGPLSLQPTHPVGEEYYNGDDTSTTVSAFTPVTVKAGVARHAIDLEIKGLDNSAPVEVGEDASHMTKATAQTLGSLPIMVQGSVSEEDPFAVSVRFGPTSAAPVPDLYKFTLTSTKLVWISLEPIGEGEQFNADVDLYLFLSTFAEPLIPFSAVPRYSGTATSHELIGVRLGAGTYYIGVSPFAGSARYRLRVVPEAPPS